MKLYHATRTANVPAIQEEGIKPIWDFVYLTDSLDSALRWMGFRFSAMGDETMAIIEVDVDENELGEGVDHSPMMVKLFGVGKSLVSEKTITPDRIREIHYYSLKQKPE